MEPLRRLAWTCVVLLTTMLLVFVAQGHAARPLYRLDAASSFDPFANETAWIKEHVDLLKGYGGFAKSHYVDAGIPTIDYHDLATEGYAPLTPESRARYMLKVEADKREGFVGTFNDDVNFGLGFRDGSQSKASYEPEAKELAALIVQERAFWPEGIIETNTQWHDLSGKLRETNVEAMIAATTLVTKEFGVGPSAGVGSGADYGALLGFIDSLNSRGKGIVLTGDRNSVTTETMEYNLATYDEVNRGTDYLNTSASAALPPTFWPGSSIDLGTQTFPGSGVRYHAPNTGLLWRGFTNGWAIVNPPGNETRTFSAGGLCSLEWGEHLSSVTLKGGQGAVLRAC